ncbi:hypothetical protein COV06_01745 [Candidatus Uhrbacteria bacterium CG10_big_fil_rev_8_21_14_0_10_50_16]|uniref:Uncharacterized protein n=1 Tax=Candidatus Uhrbacteria bacterium CG10_big_fil_rev_8_21_14_0_10_50_16 TaxID=1975039 RepID=A0A2H0RMK6_9BACT|nr:MAG: hypothetical protein COV06_01745 [Candidatus Uhrbacteria bacterium CG10_big_fil_rev_8_21_14_0_10_50_16]
MAHEAFLMELEFGIKHLPPTIPEEEQTRIQQRFEELKVLGDQVTEEAIKEAMIEIGKIEWPYRLAYKDMVMMCCSHTQHDLFLKALSPATRKKVMDMGGNDITVPELIHSSLFEEKFSPEEKYEVQESALSARLQMHDYMEEQIKNRPNDYAKSLEKARAQQAKIDEAIEQLRALAKVDLHWQPEIEGKIDQLCMGWSISEPDVSVEDVLHEVEYWKGTLAASEEEEGSDASDV